MPVSALPVPELVRLNRSLLLDLLTASGSTSFEPATELFASLE